MYYRYAHVICDDVIRQDDLNGGVGALLRAVVMSDNAYLLPSMNPASSYLLMF